MTGKPAKAFAYVSEDGMIDVNTVSGTARAAMVNAIVTASCGHVVPLNTWSDDLIRRTFINATGAKGSVKSVEITVA